MQNLIITCNAGSTNTKLAIFDAKTLVCSEKIQTKSEAETLEWLTNFASHDIRAIGHRVVHGGLEFVKPTLITAEVIAKLKELIALAPLHQPAAIRLIEKIQNIYPDLPQIACFDTAFHSSIEGIERLIPLPEKYRAEGIIRYGFHGLSYQYIASVLPEKIGELANGKVVVAHLGGGSSMCAMKNLQSVATTMGFSTLDGLMMGTRCGSLDAGVVLHLLQEKNMSVEEVSTLLYKNSGLLGVSGISAEMRDLLASDKPQAKQAVELYCYLAAKQLASLLPALGGIDALVFTGGIGENAEIVRSKIVEHLSWLGNFPVFTIATNEEAVIAKSCV